MQPPQPAPSTARYMPLFPTCAIGRIDATAEGDGLMPRLARAGLAAIAALAPGAPRLPPGVESVISLVIDAAAPAPLRLFIDGAPAWCAALRDTLFMRIACAYVEPAGAGRWSLLDRVPLAPVGFAAADALLPLTDDAYADCRILAEYLGFPEKFNFIDIDVATLCKYLAPGARRLTLHLALRGVAPGSNLFAALQPLSDAHLAPARKPVLQAPAAATLPRPGRRGLLGASLRAGAGLLALLGGAPSWQAPLLRTRLLGSALAWERVPTSAWLYGRRGLTLVDGVELRLSVDERTFAAGGLHLFAQVLEDYLRRHTRRDSFVRLVLVSERDGVELFRSPHC